MSRIKPCQWDLGILDLDQNIEYLPKPIPIARDVEITKLIVRHLNSGEAAALVANLSDDQAMVLQVFAERMASYAIRQNSADILQSALVALLLSIVKSEPRESLIVMPIFCDAMLRLKTDPSSFLESLRRKVGDPLFAPLKQFMKRADKSLENMGYVVSSDAGGFRYVRNS